MARRRRSASVAGWLGLCWLASCGAAVAQVPARLHVEQQVEHYRITGNDLRELSVQMQLHGPAHASTGRRTAGTTRWNITWSHRLEQRDGRCELVDLQVDADIRMTLPQWDGDRGNLPMVREWRRFLASLERHEAGHAQHGREAAAAIRDAMLAVPPQGSCPELARALARAARNELRRYTRLTRRYDALTDYGATQGVRFNF